MQKLSVLEYLHPDGIANTSAVFGSNCPVNLHPASQNASNKAVDLFILAPSAAECDDKEWLETAVKSMNDQLSEHGVGYVLGSLHWRRKAMKLLSQAGFVADVAFWHFPNWSSSQYLIPIEYNPARFAVDTIFVSPSIKRTLVRQIFRYSSTRDLMTRFWNSTGITVRRPGARPLFEWLFQHPSQQSRRGSAIVRSSWRGPNGASILLGFSGSDMLPSVISKAVSVASETAHLERESQVLRELGPGARNAGVQVPEMIGKQQRGQRSSLTLSFLPGRAVSNLLAVNPGLFPAILTAIIDWLERWQRATVTLRPLTWEQFERDLLVPLDRLAPSMQNAERYRKWLVSLGRTILGSPVPWVASHNDLTMANILWNEHNQLGVVDWETGCPESWPMVDFYYAVVDAVRIVGKYNNWPDAFQACYILEGSYAALVTAWQERLRLAINISPNFTEICFHACWLRHASNEHQVSSPGEVRQFLKIVEWLALHESKIDK